MLKTFLKSLYHYICKILLILRVRIIERNKYGKILRSSDEFIVLFGSPDYGNLGDHAIADAEIRFFKERFPKYNIAEISWEQYKYDYHYIKSHVSDRNLICITGGGYMGNLYPNLENLVRDVILTFQNNSILFLPQTVFFSSTDLGEREKNKSWQTYKNHSRLFFCLREEKSYRLLHELFPEGKNIYLIPDMVLYGGFDFDCCQQRSGVLMCLREDKERKIQDDLNGRIINVISKFGLKSYVASTYTKGRISFNNRKKYLKEKFNQFASAQFVITDRLHGMLFSVLTGTPCIALDNMSGKVSGVYRWLHLKYAITLVEDVSKMESIIEKVVNETPYLYNVDLLKTEFDNLEVIISEILL